MSLLVFLTCAAVSAQDLTLEQILQKNEDALGGAEVLQNIKTLKLINSIDERKNTYYLKRPDCMYSETAIGESSITTAECGTTVWLYNPRGEKPLQTLKRQSAVSFESNVASTIFWLAGFRAAGYSVELAGKEAVKDAPAYKINVISKSGSVTTYYIDAETFLPARIFSKSKSVGMDLEIDRYPADYRKVDGIVFAHSFHVISKLGDLGEQSRQEIYEDISVNIPVEDSLFEMPEGVEPQEMVRKTATLSGKLERIKVYGPSLEGNLAGDPPERAVAVYLPPSYAKEPNRRYPVVYLLHGFGNQYAVWTMFPMPTNVPMAAEKAFAVGTREMILVIPSAYTAFQGSMYSNSVTIGDWESYIAHDLVAYIDSHYRTIPERTSRGLAGHSMGGYGTVRIGMKHPEVFSSMYSLSACCMSPTMNPQPAVMDQAGKVKSLKELERLDFAVAAMLASAAAWSPNPTRPPLYLDLPIENGKLQPRTVAKWAANAPLTMVHQYIPNLKKYRAIAFDIGDKDVVDTGTEEVMLQPAKDLNRILNDYGIEHTFEIYDGDHGNRIPERLETKVFPFFSKNLIFSSEP